MLSFNVFSPFLTNLLLLVVLVFGNNISAYADTVLPSVSELNNRIERIQSDAALSEEKKSQVIGWLKKTIANMDEAETLKEQFAYYKSALSKAPLKKAEFEARLSSFKAAGLTENLGNAPLVKLEALATKEKIILTERRSRSVAIETEMAAERTLDLQFLLADARAQIKKARAEQDQAKTEIDKENEVYVMSSIAVNQYRIDMLEQRLLSRDARLQKLTAEQELIAKEIANSEARLFALENLITAHRQNEAGRLLAATQDKLVSLSQANQQLPAIAEIAKQNIDHAEALNRLIIDHDKVLRELEDVSRKSSRVEQKYDILTEQLKISQLESSSEFGAALRIQRDSLSDIEESHSSLRTYEQALTHAMLGQFKVDSERESDSQELISKSLTGKMVPSSRATANIVEIIDQREKLLRRLSSGYLGYIEDLRKIIAQLHALSTQSNRYSELVDRQLIWMPSSEVFSIQPLADSLGAAAIAFDVDSRESFIGAIIKRFKRYLVVVAFVALACCFLALMRTRLTRLLVKMKEKIGKVKRDTIGLTLLAVVITALIALPVPLMVLTAAVVMHVDGHTYQAFSKALQLVGIISMLLSFVLHSLRDDGLVDLHYKWSIDLRHLLQRHLGWFVWAFSPLLLLTLWSELQTDAVIRDTIGRISFVLAALVVGVFIFRVCGFWQHIFASKIHRNNQSPVSLLSYFIKTLALFAPLLLIILSLFGYHYTAIQLAAGLLYSVVIIVLGIYLFYLTRRAFAISERRLALERALAKRAALLARSDNRESVEASAEGMAITEDLQAIDIHTISTQTDTLLKMVAVIAVGLALWGVWSDFLLAFQRLDSFSLWHVSELVDGSPVNTAITLWDLILMMAVVIITFLAARNIPGLLEISLLSSLSLAAGTNYAVTTISRYVIVITGSVIALQLLGAQWSKLQWLVAALSVGLGFGLQEIVANFVSGIVILFERPIRIGDTVTIGEEFGTVSVIRIRATTIVDWDRREVIIPNKTFITERLINWTLTDPIMRTIIKVGVAYGSDIEQVEKSLLEIAEANHKVLDDPLPTVLFNDFGDSTLNFQLRVFIKGIHDLTPVIHEINGAIDREFRRHNIEIAFPQRDINFDSKPIEVRLLDQGKEDNK